MIKSEIELDLLLKKQGQDAQGIAQLYRNVGKDGPQRWKAPGYVEQKKRELEEAFARFKERHERIMDLKVSWRDPYCQQHVFDNILRVTEQLREKFVAMEQDLAGEEAAGPAITEEAFSEPPVEEELNQTLHAMATKEIAEDPAAEYLTQWVALSKGVERLLKFIDRPGVDKAGFVSQGQEFMTKLEAVHCHLMETLAIEYHDQYWDELFARRQQLAVLLCQVDRPITSTALSAPGQCPFSPSLAHGTGDRHRHNHYSGPRLPRIELPSFGTDPDNMDSWLQFFDLFSSLVHEREDLDDTTKMAMLKTHVVGAAAALIAYFDNVGRNYNSAWNLLVGHYHNPRQLIYFQLDKLFLLPVIAEEKASNLTSLVSSLRGALHSLRNLQEPVDSWNAVAVFLVLRRLPIETLGLWEISCPDIRVVPRLDDLLSFLDRRIVALKAIESRQATELSIPRCHAVTTSSESSVPRPSARSAIQANCSVCDRPHSPLACYTFRNMSLEERELLVAKKKLCVVCLKPHPISECRSDFKCPRDGCNLKHSSFLHRESDIKALTCNVRGPLNGLLPTARVTLRHNERRCTVKCLVDQGSMRTFVSEKVVRALALPRQRCSVAAAGIGGAHQPVRGITQISWESVLEPGKTFTMPALILSSLSRTNTIPRCNFYDGWALADPEYHLGGDLDLIIGADHYQHLVTENRRLGPLLADESHFGWLLSGRLATTDAEAPAPTWETEEKVVEIPPWSPDEMRAEAHFQEHTRRDPRLAIRLRPISPGCKRAPRGAVHPP